jgi:hypothetical protein
MRSFFLAGPKEVLMHLLEPLCRYSYVASTKMELEPELRMFNHPISLIDSHTIRTYLLAGNYSTMLICVNAVCVL